MKRSDAIIMLVILLISLTGLWNRAHLPVYTSSNGVALYYNAYKDNVTIIDSFGRVETFHGLEYLRFNDVNKITGGTIVIDGRTYEYNTVLKGFIIPSADTIAFNDTVFVKKSVLSMDFIMMAIVIGIVMIPFGLYILKSYQKKRHTVVKQ